MSNRRTETYITIRFIVLLACSVLFLCMLSLAIIYSHVISAIIAGCGLALIIVWSGARMFTPHDYRSEATERTLRIASAALSHMADGLSEESCNAVCQLLLSETGARAIAMTNTETTLAYVGSETPISQVGLPISDAVAHVLESKRVQTFTIANQEEWTRDIAQHVTPAHVAARTDVPGLEGNAASNTAGSTAGSAGNAGTHPTVHVHDMRRSLPYKGFQAGIVAPLIVADRPVGTLKLYYAHGRDINHTQLTIVRGLAELLSTQLSVYELDRQEELTARAELKALQAQINPHFLFNTLNTIASFTRTNPEKARELLRDFSSFYRHTLESSQTLVELSEELTQTSRYLQIEKARFGEDRIIKMEHIDERCKSMLVPGFILQPIVENAVRHAMRDDMPLHIDIQAAVDDNDVLLSVTDDGLGMSDAAAHQLLQAAKTSFMPTGAARKTAARNQGTGIALRNVADRIERFYAPGSGVEIVSKVNEGTSVTLRLCDAAAGNAQFHVGHTREESEHEHEE